MWPFPLPPAVCPTIPAPLYPTTPLPYYSSLSTDLTLRNVK